MPTYQVQHSFEAWTLDYLNPAWYATTHEGRPLDFPTREGAEWMATALQKRQYAAERSDRIVYRATAVPTPAEAAEAAERRERERAEHEASRPAVGKRAVYDNPKARAKFIEESGGGRVPLGTEGTVIWLNLESGWNGRFYDTPRLGVKTEAGEAFFTALSNVSVLAPELVAA